MESVEKLKEITQRGKRKNKNFLLASGYLFHRNISIYMTKFILSVFPNTRANTVSFLMIIIGISGGLLLLTENLSIQFSGIALVYLSFLLDKVDGEIARYKKDFSLRGMYLDELYHIFIPATLYIGLFSAKLEDGTMQSLFLLLLVFFSVVNRYNRKAQLILFVKARKREQRHLNENDKRNVLNRIFNSFPIKLPSVIERFDIILLAALIIIFINTSSVLPYILYFLYILLVLNTVYFIRWSILNYYGGVDREFMRLDKEGY